MANTPIGLRKKRHARGSLPAAQPRPRHHHHAVGAPETAASPMIPSGLVPIFAGWNVWDIWQADKPSFDVMALGETLQRQLQVWIENQIKDNAPGSAVADPANPLALRGDQIQPISHVTGLAIAATRADIPELKDASLNSAGDTATLRTVRFWSRASAPQFSVATSMPWPHDDDYLLNVVYQPSAKSPVTNAPQPGSLAGAASAAAAAGSSILSTVAIVGGVVLVGGVIIALASASKKAAA